MKRVKNKKVESVIPDPLCVNEAEFTDVIRKMVNTEPIRREDVEKSHKRRRNPEPSLRGRPGESLFDIYPVVRIEHSPKKKELLHFQSLA